MSPAWRDPLERFWEKVDQTGDCWLWTAYTNSKGYGWWWSGESHVLAHRFAYTLLVGPIPAGQQLDHRHTCPKNCVNPSHLRPVTPKQNSENHAGAYANSKSGVRGVTWNKGKKCWKAEVAHNRRRIHVGYFKSIEEAEIAVVAKRNELFTHNDADRSEE